MILGFTYSLASMLAVWLGITKKPIGKGQSYDEAQDARGHGVLVMLLLGTVPAPRCT